MDTNSTRSITSAITYTTSPALRTSSPSPEVNQSQANTSRRETFDQYRARIARADASPATNDREEDILKSLLAHNFEGSSIHEKIEAADQDYIAVRSGDSATNAFSGGYDTFSVCTQSGTITYFSGGSSPNAYKGCAVKFNSDTTTTERNDMKKSASTYITDHLDDSIKNGVWSRPLIESFS